jgi:hypothetical protein
MSKVVNPYRSDPMYHEEEPAEPLGFLGIIGGVVAAAIWTVVLAGCAVGIAVVYIPFVIIFGDEKPIRRRRL